MEEKNGPPTGKARLLWRAAAAEMMAAHGGTLRSQAVDIRDPEAVDHAVQAGWDDAEPLTALVNNAAGSFVSRTEDLSHRGFNAIADTVFRGTFYVTQAVAKRWIAAGLPGAVLSIVVTWVWTGSPFVVPSAMSKAGIDAMTKSLAVEWRRHGIRCNAIAPGVIPTEGASTRLRPGDGTNSEPALRDPLGRVGRLEEIGDLAAFLLAPDTGWINGQAIALDGGDWLANGACFTDYLRWGDAEWQAARDGIKARNEQDKAQRSVAP